MSGLFAGGMSLDDLFDSGRHPNVEKKEWMDTKVMALVTDDMLDQVIQDCIDSGLYALDLETTGLDNRVINGRTVDNIVGICLSHDGIHGYYIPLHHGGEGEEVNLPQTRVFTAMRRLVASPARAIFHNGKFDHEFLQFNGDAPIGEWDNPAEWEDTLILAYLRNSRARNKGLKALSSNELGYQMIELKELFLEEERKLGLDFSKLDPKWEPVIWYAASDAICTYLLYKPLYEEAIPPVQASNGDSMPSQHNVYQVEKLCVAATRMMERNRIHIDRAKLNELITLGQQEMFDALKDVYEGASLLLQRDITPSYFKLMRESFDPSPEFAIKDQITESRKKARKVAPDPVGAIRKVVPSLTKKNMKESVEFPLIYDVMSAQQLGPLLRELGVEGLQVTEKSGQIQTSQAVLDTVVERADGKFPFMAKIKRFREIQKALSSNLVPLYEDTDPGDEANNIPPCSHDSTVRVNFNAHKVDTGRFSTPAPRNKKVFQGQVRWNLQSIPAGYQKDRPECMLRIREAIIARPGYILLAADYSGQELRLATNYSGEPLWVDEFFRCSGCGHEFPRGGVAPPPPPDAPPAYCPTCGSDKIGDLHTLTALAVYGDAAKGDKAKRQKSKCVHPDTLLRTPNRRCRIGTLPLGEVDTFHALENKFGVQAPDTLYTSVLETYNGGVKPLYHVVTRRGVLTCSDAHRFQLSDGSLKSVQSGLCQGDVLPDVETNPLERSSSAYPVLTYRTFKSVPPLSYKTSKDTAYFAGLHAGGGCSSKACAEISHGHVDKTDPLGVSYKTWQSQIMEACVAVGLQPTARNTAVYLGSRHVLRWMECIGLVCGTPPTKRSFRVPDWILETGRKAMLHYLGGLLDTDGSVSVHGDVSVTTKDFVFGGQIAELFRAVGCTTSVAPTYNNTYDRWYLKISVKRKDGKKLAPYMRQSGKKARISDTELGYDRWDNEVLLVLPAGECPCMDLHVDSGDHLYVANGLAVHNSLNFAMAYGGGGSAAQRAVGVDKEEGWRIKAQFDKTYTGLVQWWKRQHQYAKVHKHVVTKLGRRYPLPDIDSDQGGFRSKAERNAVNGPIQGAAADVMKLVMGLLYREIKKRKWEELVRMVITIHDEIVFEIALEVLEEALEVIEEIMCKRGLKSFPWRIPFTIDMELGFDWTVPWDIKKFRFGKKPWPEELRPYFPKTIGGASAAPAAAPQAPASPAPAAAAATPQSAPEAAPEQAASPVDGIAPRPSGAEVVFRIPYRKLSLGMIDALARIIVECEGRGTHQLKLITDEGLIILNGGKIFVNETQFATLLAHYGIL